MSPENPYLEAENQRPYTGVQLHLNLYIEWHSYCDLKPLEPLQTQGPFQKFAQRLLEKGSFGVAVSTVSTA